MRRGTPVLFILIITLILESCKTQNTLPLRPNVVYINVDDLGWKDVGFMGSPYYSTPNINTLASQGMVFTQGYAAAANCAPSRACLLTGLNTPRHGIYTVDSSERGATENRKLIPTKNTESLPDSIFMLGHLFKQAGYITGTFGKWHVTNNPLKNGFDINIGGDHRGSPGKNGHFAPYNQLPNITNAPQGENLTDRLTDDCISFIQANKNKPFFVYLPYYDVHTPLMGKDSLIAKYKEKDNTAGQNNAVYAAMVENVDTNIGKLLKRLEDLKLTDNTLIIFTSDNGGIASVSSQKPLRAGKGSYYEGGTRVPYIIKWPKKINAGTTNTTPITNLDFFPLFADILDIDVSNKNLDGMDIMPLLKGGSIQERPLFWHFPIYLQAYNPQKDGARDSLFRTRPGSTIRFQNWKLHHYFEDNAVELYDLDTDLGEHHNISETHPEKVRELMKLLNGWRNQLNAPIPTELNPYYKNLNLHSQ